jgi:hypothetical protein
MIFVAHKNCLLESACVISADTHTSDGYQVGLPREIKG